MQVEKHALPDESDVLNFYVKIFSKSIRNDALLVRICGGGNFNFLIIFYFFLPQSKQLFEILGGLNALFEKLALKKLIFCGFF